MSRASDLSARETVRILPVRDDGILVELVDLDATLAVLEALHNDPVEGIREIVPAARTLLVSFDRHVIDADTLGTEIAGRAGGERSPVGAETVEIPVVYDGEDLDEVAAILGLDRAEIIHLHTSSDYVVAFTGFAPGFAYLAGGDPKLHVPRRKSPRTQVPAGSVGLAGEFSAVYPKASPGGWQLIGRTPLTMFDVARDPASLLKPGARVRFREIAASPAPSITIGTERPNEISSTPGSASLELVSSAFPILFQDLGRAGQAGQGISLSGATDRASCIAANRIVGNEPAAATLEVTLGSAKFRAHGRCVMAATGALASVEITSARGEHLRPPHHHAFALEDGDVVTLAVPIAGMQTYLAVRGGFGVQPVLGSASTDTLAQIGPGAVKPGHRIPVGCMQPVTAVTRQKPTFTMPAAGDVVTLDVHLGPRTDWFNPQSLKRLLAQDWSATPQSSRIGIRLAGEALERAITSELPSEGTVRGAIQVPASGQPVLFLTDHPLTGGYPVIACVALHHLDLAGQIPVGARIRFNAVSAFAPRTIRGGCL